MYPKAFTSAQATVRAYSIVLIVVFGSAVVLVGGEALGPHGGGGGGGGSFLVSYSNSTQSLPGETGNAPLRSTTEVMVMIGQSNLTNVTFTISYTDNTISPIFNPGVSVAITGPDGAGTVSGSVTTQGSSLHVTIPNVMPENATVAAGSPEEALAMAGAGNNATLGMGDWNLVITVGSPIGPRPGGSITYDISVDIEYFVGTASRV